MNRSWLTTISVYHLYHVMHTTVLLDLCYLSICLFCLWCWGTIFRLGYCKSNYTDKPRVFNVLSPIISNLGQREHSQISQGIWGRVIFSKKPAICLKWGKIGSRLLLITNRKWHLGFWLVPKWTTLDDLEWPLCTLIRNICVFFGAQHENLWEDKPILLVVRCGLSCLLTRPRCNHCIVVYCPLYFFVKQTI